MTFFLFFFFFQAEDGIRDLVRSRGLGDVYKRQGDDCVVTADVGFARVLVHTGVLQAAVLIALELIDLSLIHI